METETFQAHGRRANNLATPHWTPKLLVGIVLGPQLRRKMDLAQDHLGDESLLNGSHVVAYYLVVFYRAVTKAPPPPCCQSFLSK